MIEQSWNRKEEKKRNIVWAPSQLANQVIEVYLKNYDESEILHCLQLASYSITVSHMLTGTADPGPEAKQHELHAFASSPVTQV